jgi:hypothetical protein
MKIRKSFAGIAAGSLALAGVAVATAPTANAFPSAAVAGWCDVDGISTSAAAWNATMSVTLNGNAANGQTFNTPGTITAAYTYSTGPNNGGPAVSAASAQAEFEVINSSNAVVGTYLSNVDGPYAVGGASPFPGATLTASIPVPANGTGYTVRVKNVEFQSGAPFNIAVNCGGNDGLPGPYATNNQTDAPEAIVPTTFNALGANASVTSITGQRAGVTAYARSGDTINVTGTNWTASTAIDSVTVGGAAATNTLSVNGSGVVSGTITVPAGAATGLGSIAIVQGALSSNTGLTILGTRTLALSPANGGPGTTVSVTGSNWDPTAAISIQGYITLPFGVSSDPAVATAASASGAVSASFVISDPATTAVGAAETPPFGSPATDNSVAFFTVNADQCTRQVGSGPLTTCETKQNITASVTPGALTQQAFSAGLPGYNSTTIPMGSVTTAIAAQTLTGQINPITVTDVRGGTATWSLTAAMPDLAGSGTAAGSAIEATNLALGAVTCADQPGSATGITEGTGGNFGGAALTICDASSNNADSDGDNVGGQWIADAPLTLTVPAFQQAGAYSSTITFTLT